MILLHIYNIIPADNYKSITKLFDLKSKYDEFRDQLLNNQSCILYQSTKNVTRNIVNIFSNE